MAPLRKLLDKIAPLFEEGGKYAKLYPLYEAADSFLFTPGKRAQGAVHVRDGMDIKRLMVTVVIALLPCTIWAMVNTGWQQMAADSAHSVAFAAGLKASWQTALGLGALAFLPVYAVTIAVGGLFEAIFATVRKHEINEGFLVTSMLFPLILPPDMPLWMVGVGIAFGVVIGKEVFGGTGMNVLNPALTGRIFLFFAYPSYMSGSVWRILPEGGAVDGVTGATALGELVGHGDVAQLGYSWSDYFWGLVPGSMGETSAFCCLLGAAFLIFTKVGSWRIMTSCVLGLTAMTLLMNALSAGGSTEAIQGFLAMGPEWHLVLGGFAFGTVFMATDPVSAAQTDRGRWIYGFLIGALTPIVRVINPAYPEGVMLAIIFMNVFAPTIDYYVVKANIRRREARLGV
ncbi:MAG: NADH:ubiquinone reductase (Na(+)-transporting) subunit B [Planctomycetota bacterium]|nr:NADH:ubiquinone reductase (Na(+)-transporting) subunit B [Planctomycetota bacterium]